MASHWPAIGQTIQRTSLLVTLVTHSIRDIRKSLNASDPVKGKDPNQVTSLAS